ncbi:MAG: ATP-binding protein, partial [Dehalococcoidia bacterium]
IGLDVNRAARIGAAGHGGQVLLSQAAAELVRHALGEGIELRSLGEHRLKDLEYPEHLFQLAIPGLPIDFPPVKSLGIRRYNLPVQRSPLIGRQQEVAAVKRLLSRDDVSLLTLTGVAGTGKTRLGLQVAEELTQDIADGARFVGLAAITDPQLVITSIAQSLELHETGSRPLIETIKDYLRERALLLLLDNFEQVTAAAPILVELLAACRGLKLLITSRAVLHLRGECEFSVPPLEVPSVGDRGQGTGDRDLTAERIAGCAAVALFCKRAQEVKSDFELTDENAATITEICERLDGLPLAIELAAARSKLLPPRAMLARLNNRLKLLTGGARDLPERQQTLRGAIDWSYNLLGPDEQTLFRRLAIFAGGCTLEAAEAVCDGEGSEVGPASGTRSLTADVLDVVAALIDKSLLRQIEGTDGEPRLLMLETIREYGGERLAESGELDGVQEQHAGYFLAMAEEAAAKLTGKEQGIWLDRLEAERGNLRAALTWSLADAARLASAGRLAASLFQFWDRHGHLSEGRLWLDRILAGKDTLPATLRADLLSAAGWLAMRQSDFAPARALCDEGLALQRGIGDRAGILRELIRFGGVVWRQGDNEQAMALFDEGLALARALGDTHSIAICLNSLGSVAGRLGEDAQAQALFEESLALWRRLGDHRVVAVTLNNVAIMASRRGDHRQARMLYEESLTLYRKLGDKRGMALTLNNLGNVLRRQGDDEQARELYGESLTLKRSLGDSQGVAVALQDLAALAVRHGDHRQAQALAAESLGQVGIEGDRRCISQNLHTLARVASALAQFERAARLMGAARAIQASNTAALEPAERIQFEADRSVIQAKLSGTTFDKAWSEGAALSVDRAIADALAQDPSNAQPFAATIGGSTAGG